MGIDELGEASRPQRLDTPLSQRSLGWWLFYMPGTVILWFQFMFPNSVTQGIAGGRQRNVPLLQLGYSIIFYVVVAGLVLILKVMYENGKSDETHVSSPSVASAISNAGSAETADTSEPPHATPPTEPEAPEIPDPMKQAIEARLSPEFTACMSNALATPAMLECISAETATQDAALNETYKRVMSKLPPEGQATVRQAQRAWIKERDEKCDQEAAEYEQGTFGPVAHASCYLQREVERTIELERIEPR